MNKVTLARAKIRTFEKIWGGWGERNQDLCKIPFHTKVCSFYSEQTLWNDKAIYMTKFKLGLAAKSLAVKEECFD